MRKQLLNVMFAISTLTGSATALALCGDEPFCDDAETYDIGLFDLNANSGELELSCIDNVLASRMNNSRL